MNHFHKLKNLSCLIVFLLQFNSYAQTLNQPIDQERSELKYRAKIKTVIETSWQKHRRTVSDDAPTLEFSSADAKPITVDLLFDTYESATSENGQDREKRVIKIEKPRDINGPMEQWWNEYQKNKKPICKALVFKYIEAQSQNQVKVDLKNPCITKFEIYKVDKNTYIEKIELHDF